MWPQILEAFSTAHLNEITYCIHSIKNLVLNCDLWHKGEFEKSPRAIPLVLLRRSQQDFHSDLHKEFRMELLRGNTSLVKFYPALDIL